MKHKSTKRSISHKTHRRVYQTHPRRSSTPQDTARTISPTRIHLGTGPAHLDSHAPCLKSQLNLKSQKILKRDLLRCSNQRPSLLGPQTLQPPRLHHHGSQHVHSIASSSSDRERLPRRRSFSVHSHLLSGTIDRIGPWPDVSITRLRSDGNDLLRPLKTFRNTKNPRVFSPKYYAALTENTSRFKFHPSTRTYMDEYRKQKGYLLDARTAAQTQASSIASSFQLGSTEDDQYSVTGTFSGLAGEMTARDRTEALISNFSLLRTEMDKSSNAPSNQTSSAPNIPTALHPINIQLPSLPTRHHPPRATRAPLGHPIIALPALSTSSMQYMNSMNSVEKTYGEHKKSSRQPPSKLYFLDGRQKKRYVCRCRSSSTRTETHHFSSTHIGFLIVFIVMAR